MYGLLMQQLAAHLAASVAGKSPSAGSGELVRDDAKDAAAERPRSGARGCAACGVVGSSALGSSRTCQRW